MLFQTIEDLYEELRKFRLPKDDRGSAKFNQFWQVSENEILEIENTLGFSVPSQLRNFYLEVGHGHLVTDSKGEFQRYYLNIIVEPSRLLSLWDRTDVTYLVDENIADEGEMPFFDTGDHYYLVMRPKDENEPKIYHPFDRKPVAKDFNEFVMKLYENTIFYTNHEGVYED